MSLRSRGEYVYELVNEGAGMTGLRIGVVTRAGDRQYEVCWESGFRRRYRQGYGHQLQHWDGWTDDERRRVLAKIFAYCGV